jgi:hypothetical protein
MVILLLFKLILPVLAEQHRRRLAVGIDPNIRRKDHDTGIRARPMPEKMSIYAGFFPATRPFDTMTGMGLPSRFS